MRRALPNLKARGPARLRRSSLGPRRAVARLWNRSVLLRRRPSPRVSMRSLPSKNERGRRRFVKCISSSAAPPRFTLLGAREGATRLRVACGGFRYPHSAIAPALSPRRSGSDPVRGGQPDEEVAEELVAAGPIVGVPRPPEEGRDFGFRCLDAGQAKDAHDVVVLQL